jgi:hypothetical protein
MGLKAWFRRTFTDGTNNGATSDNETEEIEVRARDDKGRFVPDDPKTEKKNEAYKKVKVVKKSGTRGGTTGGPRVKVPS